MEKFGLNQLREMFLSLPIGIRMTGSKQYLLTSLATV